MMGSNRTSIILFLASSVLSVFAIKYRIHVTARGLHYPLLMHSTLHAKDTRKRVIIIGDVHGCLDELQHLLVKCRYSDDDKVILVGDLVNKGPKSAEVVAFARKIGALSVLGNHEYSLIPKLLDKTYADDSYLSKLSRADIDWLRKLPFTISIPLFDAIVVHAGLLPGRTLTQQSHMDMLTMRSILLPPPPPPPPVVAAAITGIECAETSISASEHGVVSNIQSHSLCKHKLTASKKPAISGKSVMWASMWMQKPHVYFGHDAKAGLQLLEHCTGLDSGAVYGKQLTAIILPSRELVQVQVPQYAPT